MSELWRRIRRYLEAATPTAIGLREARIQSLERNHLWIKQILKVIGGQRCLDGACPVHVINSETGATLRVCPWCVADLALNGRLDVVNVPSCSGKLLMRRPTILGFDPETDGSLGLDEE